MTTMYATQKKTIDYITGRNVVIKGEIHKIALPAAVSAIIRGKKTAQQADVHKSSAFPRGICRAMEKSH